VWQNELVRIVRFLIGDLDSTTYSDDRLEETILVAAQLLLSTMDFSQTYSVDVDATTLSPDCTEGTKDDFFIGCLSLKTAVIILNSEAKTAAAQSWRVKDSTSSIDTTASYQAMHQLAKELSDKLDKYIFDYRAGNSLVGGAVLTPYTYEGLSNQGTEIRNFY
jgi:hypothetical protein